MSIVARVNTIKEITGHPLNRHRKLAAVVDYFRWNLGLRLLDRECILPLAGDAKIILSSRQNYATLAYTCGLWDFEEMMFLLHVLRPSDSFVDVGANVGGYSLLASAVAGAKSLAFEPIPFTHEELIRNIRLNDIGHLVDARRVCLGASGGTVRMTADRGGLNHVMTTRDTGAYVDTEVVRLDDVLDGGSCHFMKMDAEGYEAEIISGATATLKNPALLGLVVELNDSGLRYGHTNEAVHASLTGFGFSPYHYDARRKILNPRAGFRSNSLNVLYVRDVDTILQRIGSAPAISVQGQLI
jgi:FkbM family methyltransferase